MGICICVHMYICISVYVCGYMCLSVTHTHTHTTHIVIHTRSLEGRRTSLCPEHTHTHTISIHTLDTRTHTIQASVASQPGDTTGQRLTRRTSKMHHQTRPTSGACYKKTDRHICDKLYDSREKRLWRNAQERPEGEEGAKITAHDAQND